MYETAYFSSLEYSHRKTHSHFFTVYFYLYHTYKKLNVAKAIYRFL